MTQLVPQVVTKATRFLLRNTGKIGDLQKIPRQTLEKGQKFQGCFFFWMNRTVEIRYTGVFPSKNHIQSWMKLPEMILVAAQPRTGNVSCAGRRKPDSFSAGKIQTAFPGLWRDPRNESQACLKSMPCGRFWELWTICIYLFIECCWVICVVTLNLNSMPSSSRAFVHFDTAPPKKDLSNAAAWCIWPSTINCGY